MKKISVEEVFYFVALRFWDCRLVDGLFFHALAVLF